MSHLRIIAARLSPRNIASWRASRLRSARWPRARRPHGQLAIDAEHLPPDEIERAGPNNGCPRSTVRISTPSMPAMMRCRMCLIDRLNSAAVGAEPAHLRSRRRRRRCGGSRPFLGDDVEQGLDAFRIHRERAPAWSSHRTNGRGQRRSGPGWFQALAQYAHVHFAQKDAVAITREEIRRSG